MSRVTTVQHGTNAALIATAQKLYPMDGYVVDLTYGVHGGFWKQYRPDGLFGITPETGIDFRSVPLRDGVARHVTFDPPYVTKGGHATSTIGEMNDRYGMLHVEKNPMLQWERQILPGIAEANRICVKDGLLWFKCMDYVTSGKVHWFTKLALPALAERGWRLIDEFILAGRPGPQPSKNLDGTARRQVHAARSHSVLMIARKVRHVEPALGLAVSS